MHRKCTGHPHPPTHSFGLPWAHAPPGGPPGELAAAGSSVLKVIKGGAFSTEAAELRSAARLGVELDHWAADVGFRCAGDPKD